MNEILKNKIKNFKNESTIEQIKIQEALRLQNLNVMMIELEQENFRNKIIEVLEVTNIAERLEKRKELHEMQRIPRVEVTGGMQVSLRIGNESIVMSIDEFHKLQKYLNSITI